MSGPRSSRLEIVTRTERRRRYSDAEKVRLLAECEAPGSSLGQVARKYEIAPSLLFSWQISAAFVPFEAFTPKATHAFVEGLRLGMGNLEEYTRSRVEELDREYQALRLKMKRLEELFLRREISDGNYERRLEALKQKHDQVFAELQAVRKADHKTYGHTLNLIQHFTNLKDFQRLGEFLLAKAEIARVLLSNRILDNGRFRFSYVFPLDDLLQLTSGRVWW